MIGIGDVVVFIGYDGDHERDCPMPRLPKGSIHRVTGVDYDLTGGILLDLAGYEHPEWGYGLEYFKPLRKADTSFTALIKRRRPVMHKEEV